MTTVTGLRERKKIETRRHIADVAARLFAARGFEAVTVDEVAEAAQVSKKTVFNYFPTKEDLVFDLAEERNQDLARAVRDRRPGQTVTAAFRDDMLGYLASLREQPPGFQRGGIRDLVQASPSLQRRAREHHFENIRLVAGELAALTGAGEHDPVPIAIAHSLLGAHRVLFRECHRRLAEGQTPAEVASAVEPDVRRVFDLLERGIGGYALVPDEPAR